MSSTRSSPGRTPTVVDVARAAGVSVGTVSNVLTGAKQVSPETRASVERAIAELGYLHNGVAASLRARSSRTVGLIVPDIATPAWGELTRGASDVLRDSGYATVLFNSDGDPERQRENLQDALQRRLDGALIAASALAQDGWPQPESLPAVTVTGAAAAMTDHIDGGDEYGGSLAAALLRQLGHTELVVVVGDSVPERARSDGFARSAAQTGPSPAVLEGHELLRAPGDLLERLGSATAAFCTSDALAGQLAAMIRRRGGRVPEQFSVIGYGGGARADAAASDLTSVVPASYALGASGARLLLHRIRHPAQEPQTLTLRPQMRAGRTAARGPGRTGQPDPRRLGLRQTIHQLDYELPGRGQELALELAERFATTGTGDQVHLSFDVRGPLDYERRLGQALGADVGGGAGPAAPDLFHGNGGYLTAALVGEGQVLPLTEFADALDWDRRLSPQLLREGRYAPDGLRWGDADAPLYCVSYYAEILGLFVDPRVLQRVGVAVPRTLDELEEALAAAHSAGIDGLAFGDADGIAGVHLLEALLTRLLDADALRDVVFGLGANLDRERAQAALETIARWSTRGYLSPAHRQLAPAAASQRFVEGKALFLLADISDRATLEAACGAALNFVLVPGVTADDPPRAVGSGGGALGIAAQTAHPEVAARWLDFLLGPAAAAVVEAHGLIPLTQPHTGARDAAAAAIRELLERDGLVYYPSVASQTMLATMRSALTNVMEGGSSADAVDLLRDDLRASLARRAGWT